VGDCVQVQHLTGPTIAKKMRDEARRQAHQLCAHDGLERRSQFRFLHQQLGSPRKFLSPIWHLEISAVRGTRGGRRSTRTKTVSEPVEIRMRSLRVIWPRKP